MIDALQEWAAQFPALRLDLVGKLVLAAVLGGAVGWEREHKGKPAGLRTNILICIGATLLTDVGRILVAEGSGDPARVAAQIVSGVGFLGAGTIIQSRGDVKGLTTAATLWVVAAIGIAIGTGQESAAVVTTVMVLLVLIPLGMMEDRLDPDGHDPGEDEPGDTD